MSPKLIDVVVLRPSSSSCGGRNVTAKHARLDLVTVVDQPRDRSADASELAYSGTGPAGRLRELAYYYYSRYYYYYAYYVAKNRRANTRTV